MPGTLYLVATPIGNLEDITTRALNVLRDVELIACEDTRHTRKLLTHYGIRAKLISYHEHNEGERADELVRLLKEGKSIALVSDAGTPAINDPGYRLVRVAIECKAGVVPIPGPTAFVSALIASGLPTDEFYFGGFLPPKTNARRSKFTSVKTAQATLIFYETPHRLSGSLRDAYEILGEREAAIARELTKLHEEIIRARLSDLVHAFSEKETRGEIVLIIDRNEINVEGKVQTEKTIRERIAELESEGMDQRAALKRAAREFGINRSEAYRRLISER